MSRNPDPISSGVSEIVSKEKVNKTANMRDGMYVFSAKAFLEENTIPRYAASVKMRTKAMI
jgi:hypothetical protein